MQIIKNFISFINESDDLYTFDQLSQESQENAIEQIRDGMYEGEYGSYDIPQSTIDDDYLFEPSEEEMEKVFGRSFEEYTRENPMIGNDRTGISFIGKDDPNYYLHCKNAIEINNDELFLGWLGFFPFYWEVITYSFRDEGTYTKIDFEIDAEDEIDPDHFKEIEKSILIAEKKFQTHMSNVLDRITKDIEYEYSDVGIKQRIEDQEILFDSEGNPS